MIAKARTLPIPCRIRHAARPVAGGSASTGLCTQAQNNLLYMALSNLDAAIFQVIAAIAQRPARSRGRVRWRTCRVRGSVVLSSERACVRACVRVRACVAHGPVAQVTCQLKILTTAACSISMLQRKLSHMQVGR